MRVTADEDLKLADTLAYYSAESAAAKDLLYRRSRALADYAAANRALDRARAKQRDIAAADAQQAAAHKRFTDISQMARRGKLFLHLHSLSLSLTFFSTKLEGFLNSILLILLRTHN